jgi:hypothetical protein
VRLQQRVDDREVLDRQRENGRVPLLVDDYTLEYSINRRRGAGLRLMEAACAGSRAVSGGTYSAETGTRSLTWLLAQG